MTQTITAVFSSIAEAESAARDLATSIPGVRGRIYGREEINHVTNLPIPSEDRALLSESVRRGDAVLHADIPDDRFHLATDTLENAGAVDLDAREDAWRREGWTYDQPETATGSGLAGAGASGMTGAAAASHYAAPSTDRTTADERVAGTATGLGTGLGETDRTTGVATDRDQVIPVVEERLIVGKRETGHGRVRVRSYVVEKPVSEQVTLHEEHVSIERRPVDRPAGENADFRERTIEATETSEEVVVSKEARVTEEVVINKTADETTRTVKDTVRRTEVEVEDDRNRKDRLDATDTTRTEPDPR